jgi:ketosteroid isomerase-like protein
LPFTGQSAGLIHDVEPAAAIVVRLMAETEAALDHAHEDVVWKPFFSTETRALRGRAEVIAAWREQVELLGISIDAERYIAVGDKVVAPLRWTGKGQQSGATVEATAVQVYTLSDGKIAAAETFDTLEEALAAAESPG